MIKADSEWRAEYSVGVETLDEQHRFMFALGRKITELRPADAQKVMQELLAYLVNHCAAEEAHMETIAFPDLDSHRQKHEDILLEVQKLVTPFDPNPREILKMKLFFFNWLVNHVVKVDSQYFAFAQKNLPPA